MHSIALKFQEERGGLFDLFVASWRKLVSSLEVVSCNVSQANNSNVQLVGIDRTMPLHHNIELCFQHSIVGLVRWVDWLASFYE